MIAKLKAAGFSPSRAKTNVGYNPARMTFVATAPDLETKEPETA